MADFTSFLADMDQVAYVRSAELTEGDGRGCRIIDVFNGSGLAWETGRGIPGGNQCKEFHSRSFDCAAPQPP